MNRIDRKDRQSERLKYVTRELDTGSVGVFQQRSRPLDIEQDNRMHYPDELWQRRKGDPALWGYGKRKTFDVTIEHPPNKTAGRGFGDVEVYSRVRTGDATRGLEADSNPRNAGVDRFFLTMNNFSDYTNRVSELPRTGIDTRYLNKEKIKSKVRV